MNTFFWMALIFAFMTVIQFLINSKIEKKLSSNLKWIFFVLWVVFTLLGFISRAESEEYNRIENLISSIDDRADNIRKMGAIYHATHFKKHKNQIVSKLDMISRQNHEDLYDIHSKSKCEIEDYRSSNEHLLSYNCKLFEDFWANPSSKRLRSLENFFQVHSFLNYFSDEKYNYFEYEKLLKFCGCPDK